MLIQCAWAARIKGSYLQAQFHRLRSRRGAKKAIGAVAASILTAAYHMLKNGPLYQIWAPITSITGQKRTKSSACSADFRPSALLSTPHQQRPPHDLLTGPGFVLEEGSAPYDASSETKVLRVDAVAWAVALRNLVGFGTFAESRTGRIGPINLEVKLTGEIRAAHCGGWKRGMVEML
jgi:hypothetical protein